MARIFGLAAAAAAERREQTLTLTHTFDKIISKMWIV